MRYLENLANPPAQEADKNIEILFSISEEVEKAILVGAPVFSLRD